jgi:parallel beta-helix repeat protein
MIVACPTTDLTVDPRRDLMPPQKSQRFVSRTLLLAIAILTPMMLAVQCPPPVILHSGDSIQEAVDAAMPGTTIFLLPGVYTGTPGAEAVVDVQMSGITITGSHRAVIDATGFEYGIQVGASVPITAAGCPPITMTDFKLNGTTIQNAEDSSIRLIGVDRFSIENGRHLDNYEYGPFPICSRNGKIRRNYVSGSQDAAIYVGDDFNVDVLDNFVTDSVAGIEIENTSTSVVRGNTLTGNTGGILAFVLPGLPQPFTDTVLIENNRIFDNNRTNTGSGSVGTLPEGTGILVIGGDDVTVRNNDVTGNDSFGIAVIGNPFSFFDPRIEPFVDNLLVEGNTFLDNGANPDPLRTFTPGADMIFLPDVFDTSTGTLLLVDPDPTDNCFTNNDFDTDFPPGIVGAFECI